MPTTTTRHAQAVTWARKNLGQHEIPMGSNTGPFVIECQRATDLGGTRWPWCVAFFQRAWQVVGYPLPYRGASAYGFADWAQANGWTCSALDAQPGDGVIINEGAGHCAMLSAKVDGQNVPTISGNYADAVTYHVFTLPEVRCFIHIPADPKTPTPAPPPAKLPVYEVVTSISGRRKLVYASGANAVSRKLGRILNRYGGVTITRKKP